MQMNSKRKHGANRSVQNSNWDSCGGRRRGFFNGPFNGIDATVKDSKRFAKTNGWSFFTFGHRAMPYAASAAEAPVRRVR
jgi:Cytochrome P460